jgi:hypothetical protein
MEAAQQGEPGDRLVLTHDLTSHARPEFRNGMPKLVCRHGLIEGPLG